MRRRTPAKPWTTLSFLLIALGLALWSRAVRADELPFRVPPGFEVSLYADDALAHDIYSMTVDSHGRVVVAGAGYVKILHDDDHDGHADRATLYSAKPASGAHGLLFIGDDLICTGDNSVLRLHDADGDGVAEGEPEAYAKLRHPEHGANGLVQGPDGWIYVICGNDAGISEANVTTQTSPVREPKCGGVVRISPDGKQQEVFAHGFRNPYDLDFNAQGQLFTVDSDGERDHHLPWYAPTRLFDIQQGMEHGWLLAGHQRSWNRPQSFFDNVDRLVEIGRGSPTGVACYRHRQFPAHYRGGIFSACWTLGTVYYFPLEPAGSTYRSQKEIFLQTTGEIGFSPCDLAVGPQGDLFVAIGGRKTIGSVFRVRYTGPDAKTPDQPAGELAQVLAADQPLSSWSRAQWQPLTARLGREAFERAIADEELPLAQRIRAVEVLVDRFGGTDLEQAAKIEAAAAADFEAAPLAARIVWALGRTRHDSAGFGMIARLTAASDERVQRAAWEALATIPAEQSTGSPPDWVRAFNSNDRRIRTAAILAAGAGCGQLYHDFVRERNSSKEPFTIAESFVWPRLHLCSKPEPYFDSCVKFFTEAPTLALRLEAVRLMQLGLGDVRVQPGQAEVFSGYVGNRLDWLDADGRRRLGESLALLFATRDQELNRELARLLGMLGVENTQLLGAISRQWTSQTTTEDDIHYLIVSALLPGQRTSEVTDREVTALLNLETKLRAAGGHPSQNWPLRVAEMFEELCKRDPALAEQLVERVRFRPPRARALRGPLAGRIETAGHAQITRRPEGGAAELRIDLSDRRIAGGRKPARGPARIGTKSGSATRSQSS